MACCCFSRGVLSAHVRLDRDKVQPGEEVGVILEVDNRSKLPVDAIEVRNPQLGPGWGDAPPTAGAGWGHAQPTAWGWLGPCSCAGCHEHAWDVAMRLGPVRPRPACSLSSGVRRGSVGMAVPGSLPALGKGAGCRGGRLRARPPAV